MNKKLLILSGFLLSISLLFGFTLAQNTSIGDVSVGFCNTQDATKSLSMVLDSGREGEICMEFSNFSENDVNIRYGFVDGSTTNDKYKSKACQNEGDKDVFGQYVRQDVSEINIPAMTKVKQKAYVKFPSGLTGMVNGCLTYFVANAKDTTTIDSAMFDVLVRKAAFIDVLVGGNLSRSLKLGSEGNPINVFFDNDIDKLVLEVVLDNMGNINEGATMAGEISNIFGYSASFSGEVVKVLSEDKAVLRMEINQVPWYKGPFNITLNINSVPEFDFDPSAIPDDMKAPIYIEAKTSVFLFPWIVVYIVGGLLVLFILVKIVSKHLKFQ